MSEPTTEELEGYVWLGVVGFLNVSVETALSEVPDRLPMIRNVDSFRETAELLRELATKLDALIGDADE